MKILRKICSNLLVLVFLMSFSAPLPVSAQEASVNLDNVTRAELIKSLLEADNFNPESITEIQYPFADVPGDLQAYAERMVLMRALNHNGEGSLLRPNEEITLYSALELAFKYKGVPIPRVVFDSEDFSAKVKNIGPNSVVAPVLDRAMKLGLYSPSNGTANLFVKLPQEELNSFVQKVDALDYVLEGTKIPTIKINPIEISPTQSSVQSEKEFKIFADVWKRINNEFYDQSKVNKQNLLYKAIGGLVDGLGDPYSSFQEPTKSKSFRQSLGNEEVDGIGATVTMDDMNRPVIVTPLKNSPAEKAGLMPGDIILEVNGITTKGLTLIEVVSKIKGPSGTTVSLSISRNNVLRNFEITRASITVTPIEGELTSDNILVLTIRNFGSGVEQGFQEIIEELGSTKFKGIVIDVRSNPGGYLGAATELAGHFVPKGETVAKIKYGNGVVKNDYSNGEGEYSDLPLAVLINGGSASAAEIFAAALQEKAGATLVGEKSFGKGTVQELINYSDESALKLTVASWLTPSGKDINKVGVEPDLRVLITDNDKKVGNDPQMNKAILSVK